MTVRNVGIRLKTEGKAEVKRDLQEVGAAGKAAGDTTAAGFDQATVAMDKQSKAMDRQIERWKAMAKAARDAQTAEEQQAKFNAILGVGGGSEKSAAASAEVFMGGGKALTRQEQASRLNLVRQGADIFTTASMGMNPGMIAIQQGPQILDALATSGLKATAAQVALGGAVAVAGAAVITAMVAQQQYEKSIIDVEVATKGLGAAAGMTAAGVLAQADAAASAGEISKQAARQFAAEYVATGKIGQGVLQDLVGLTRDYAATTRQDAAGATKELAAAFSQPAKGASDLNDKLHFLRESELQHIENLARSGREAEAQAVLVDKLKVSLLDASDATTGWGRAADGLKQKWLGVWDAVGKAVDRMVTGGSSADKVAAARLKITESDATLANYPAWMRNIPGSQAAQAVKDRRDAQAVIDAEYKKYVAEMDGLRRAALSEQDSDRRQLMDRYNPNAAKLRNLKSDRENMMRLGLDKTDDGAKALKDLNAEIDALSKGYKSAAEAAAALAKAGRNAAKEAREDAREKAEALRKANDLDVQRLRGAVAVARAGGDAGDIAWAELQLRMKTEILARERDGLDSLKAKLEVEKQISDELRGQYAAILRGNSNVEFDKEGFVSAEDRMAKALVGANIKPFSQKTAFLENLRVETGSAFHDGLMAGAMGGSFFSTFFQRLKYTAASALADLGTNALFGKSDGSGKVGLIASVMKAFVPHFAKGTDYAPSGLMLVGEEGPELLNLRRPGAQISTAAETRALLSNADRALRTQVSNLTVSPVFAPTIDARGAGPNEVTRLEAALAKQEREFEGRVITTVQQALGDRMIKV